MRLRTLSTAALVLLLGACGGGIPAPASGPGGAAPRESLERFFQLADEQRFLDMAWIFGSRAGPYVRQVEPSEAERTMYLFSCLLRPLRKSILNEMPVPGSIGAAVELTVRLEAGARSVQLPFRTTRGPGDRWFVENFPIEVLTQSPLPIAPECVPRGPAR